MMVATKSLQVLTAVMDLCPALASPFWVYIPPNSQSAYAQHMGASHSSCPWPPFAQAELTTSYPGPWPCVQ